MVSITDKNNIATNCSQYGTLITAAAATTNHHSVNKELTIGIYSITKILWRILGLAIIPRAD